LIDEKLLNIQADQALLRQFVEHVGNFHFKTDLSSSGIIFNNGGYSSQSTSSRSEHDGTEITNLKAPNGILLNVRYVAVCIPTLYSITDYTEIKILLFFVE
jgi:hypothetical protein